MWQLNVFNMFMNKNPTSFKKLFAIFAVYKNQSRSK